MKKIQPNLIPSKTIPIGCVDLIYEIKFAICHWTWEIGYIWHLQRNSGCFMCTNIWWLIAIVPSFPKVARILSKKPRCYLTWPDFCHQIFLKSAKFNLFPKSNDKLQFYFGIQIYSSIWYYFWWSQNWLNFFTIKIFVPQCDMPWRILRGRPCPYPKLYPTSLTGNISSVTWGIELRLRKINLEKYLYNSRLTFFTLTLPLHYLVIWGVKLRLKSLP